MPQEGIEFQPFYKQLYEKWLWVYILSKMWWFDEADEHMHSLL